MTDFSGWMTTELALENWRGGPVSAERLSAHILMLENFQNVRPQSPLGGPDGRKDILCNKGGKSFVAAVYFPNSKKTFSNIKKKFLYDLEGASFNDQDGLVFVTNQVLTPKQRSILKSQALAQQKECEILHQERIRVHLDSPAGYGLRAQFLGIPLSSGDQLAFFQDEHDRIEANMRNFSAKLDQLLMDQGEIVRTMQTAFAVTDVPSSPQNVGAGEFIQQADVEVLSDRLAPELILLFHRLCCGDLPSRVVGRYREVSAWLGTPEDVSSRKGPVLPEPEEIPSLLQKICAEWRKSWPKILKSSTQEKLFFLSKFHSDFLKIHPFTDGNGRVARAILMQQCIDLFGKADMSLFQKGSQYFSALKDADKGEYDSLSMLIEPVISMSGSR